MPTGCSMHAVRFLQIEDAFAQNMNWIERVSASLQDTSDEYLRGAVQGGLGNVSGTPPR